MAYLLRYIAQHQGHDVAQAQGYFQRCVVFDKTLGMTPATTFSLGQRWASY